MAGSKLTFTGARMSSNDCLNEIAFGDNAGSVSVATTGATHAATSQVTTSTSPSTAAIARPTRRSCLIRNLDTSISVYIGPATVSAANGMLLKAGESIPITAVTLLQVIAASGSPVIAVFDEYD